jgi:predicted aldo/keto reductase-like oxidoreductase
MERLQTDYIDCLMIQGTPTVESLKNEYFHQAVADLKKESKVRFIGAASHGSRGPGQGEPMETVLLGAIEDGRFDIVLFVYNFIQREAGEQILEAAAKKNIGTTIMKSNPLARYFEMQGKIEQMKKAGEPTDEKAQKFIAQMEETAKKAEPFLQKNNLKEPAEIKAAALKFVLSNPQVHVLNLAFRNFDDIRSNLILSGAVLRKKDENILAAYKEACGGLYCRHACGLCESSCPYNVPVNTIMRYSHYFEAQGSEKFAMEKYARLETPKADHCRNCAGFCQAACPYGVPIQALLSIAHAQLTMA